MTKEGKKGTIKILLAVAGLIVVGLTSMQALGIFQGEIKRDVLHIHEAIQNVQADDLTQWADIDENTYYRLGDTKDTEILTERIDNVQGDVDEIKGDVKEILNRLPK